MAEWQPIGAAPDDMTEIIGMDAKGAIYRTWFFAPSSITRNWHRWPGGHKWEPVKWIPMPQEAGRAALRGEGVENG